MSHSLVACLVVVLHAVLHVGFKQFSHLSSKTQFYIVLNSTSETYLGLQFVGSDTSTDLHQEDDAEKDGEGESHAVVLLDGAAATEEGDKEDNASNDDKEDRSGEELVPEEVKVLTVGSLDDPTSDNEEQS